MTPGLMIVFGVGFVVLSWIWSLLVQTKFGRWWFRLDLRSRNEKWVVRTLWMIFLLGVAFILIGLVRLIVQIA